MSEERLANEALYVMKKEIDPLVKELNKQIRNAVENWGLRVKVDTFGIRNLGTRSEVPFIEVDVWKELR